MGKLALTESDRPLFRTVDEALRWAYRVQRAAPKTSALAQWIGKRRPAPLLPLGLDGAAQAGMIKAAVESLQPHQRNATVARYGQGRERAAARAALIDYIRPRFGTGISPYRMVRELVAKYFGKQVWVADLADRYGCHVNTAQARWEKTREVLNFATNSGSDELLERFRSGRLVE